jgi:adenylate cyclase
VSAASRTPLVGWLFPSPDEPGAAIARRTRLVLTVLLSLANFVGAAVVFVFLLWVLPTPPVDDPAEVRLVNLIAAASYVLMGTVVGALLGSRKLRDMRDWLRSDRPATQEQRRQVLRAPYRIVGVHAILWTTAAVLFGLLNWTYSAELGARVVTTVLFGGLTTCAIAYLVTERQLRPAAARALAEGFDEGTSAPGIRARSLLAWLLGTGIPLVGLFLVAISTLTDEDFNADELAVAVLALAGLALVAGLYVSTLAARAVADPVRSVREALAEVERGDLEAEVPVYDGSEVGLLQAGFNRMVGGLRERERIHDLFGRHVGEEVARAALEQEVELGGETREVSVLFVDLVGSTKLAAERDPAEVVDVLNRFFGVVVEVVREHGGWVNKFEGDAALAVFGAPAPLDDHASRALAAGRDLARRLSALDGVEAGIGVSGGEVVAGNIGEEQRFEYTVIGDPVNEAARLTELAKETEAMVLASGSAIERASEQEAAHWELDEAVKLRGRSAETRLAKPRD